MNPGSKRQLINEDLGSFGKQNWSLKRTAKWSEFTDPFKFMAYMTGKKFINSECIYFQCNSGIFCFAPKTNFFNVNDKSSAC